MMCVRKICNITDMLKHFIPTSFTYLKKKKKKKKHRQIILAKHLCETQD